MKRFALYSTGQSPAITDEAHQPSPSVAGMTMRVVFEPGGKLSLSFPLLHRSLLLHALWEISIGIQRSLWSTEWRRWKLLYDARLRMQGVPTYFKSPSTRRTKRLESGSPPYCVTDRSGATMSGVEGVFRLLASHLFSTLVGARYAKECGRPETDEYRDCG